MPEPKIAVIPGSNRRDSCNAKLAKAIVAEIGNRQAKAEFVSLRDYPMDIYDGDSEQENGVPDNAKKLGALLAEQNGIVLVSPEYNASFSPLLKNALDWLSRDLGDVKPYADKIFALASCSPGGLGGIRGLMHLRGSLVSIGAEMITTQLCIGNGFKAFDEKGELVSDRDRNALKKMVDVLVKQAGYCAREG